MRTLESIRPEALADVPGDADYDLTRAVVLYGTRHQYWQTEAPGLDDLGVAVVVDGSFPLVAEAIDLGSGRSHNLDLTVQVVVLDWVNERTLEHVRALRATDAMHATAWGARSQLAAYGEVLLAQVIRRNGWSALTRPLFLRIGFRDLVRDLDVNESPHLRVRLAAGGVATMLLEAEDAALRVRAQDAADLVELRGALEDAFDGAEIVQRDGDFVVPLPLPRSLEEVERFSARLGDGILRLYARFEPDRFDAVSALLSAVGRRNSLVRHAVPQASPDALRLAS